MNMRMHNSSNADLRWPTASAAGSMPMSSNRIDVLLQAAGIIDQALLGLIHLTQTAPGSEIPRSHLLDALQLYHQYRQSAQPVSQLRLVGSTAGCATRLARQWKQTLSEPTNEAYRSTPTTKAARYYTIASLAAASVLIPWLMLRKRHA